MRKIVDQHYIVAACWYQKELLEAIKKNFEVDFAQFGKLAIVFKSLDEATGLDKTAIINHYKINKLLFQKNTTLPFQLVIHNQTADQLMEKLAKSRDNYEGLLQKIEGYCEYTFIVSQGKTQASALGITDDSDAKSYLIQKEKKYSKELYYETIYDQVKNAMENLGLIGRRIVGETLKIYLKTEKETSREMINSLILQNINSHDTLKVVGPEPLFFHTKS